MPTVLRECSEQWISRFYVRFRAAAIVRPGFEKQSVRRGIQRLTLARPFHYFPN
jgi:hypothetical protein